MNELELWLPITDYPNYSISSQGRVRNNTTGKVLKPFPNSFGYLSVDLQGRKLTVHRLVATHFIPNNNETLEVNHKDGIKGNNSFSNLEWVTRGYNISHAHKLGLRNYKGENHPQSKLTDWDRDFISTSSLSIRELYMIYDVSYYTIWDIRHKYKNQLGKS